jgi:hypothetical protein|tara:strand:+ start:971 stop:3427 length:2457 start_codon:yes stop_codon:yes gene_type:complete
MADKTPVRVVFNASNVATGMAEFQTGESIPVTNGGTGLTAVGGAGQVLKVNAAGNALEFGAEGDISITNLVAPTNSDLTLTTSGTGNIVLDAITFRGTTISSADSTTININDNVEIDGNLVVTGTVDFNDQNISNVGSLSIDSISGDADTNTSITFSGSDVITIATGGSGRLTIGDGALSPVTDNQIDLGTSSLEFKDAFFDGTVTTDALTVSGTSSLADVTMSTSLALATGATVTGIADEDNMSSNSATFLATQQSIKAYVDSQVTAQDLDFQADSGGALAIDLDSEALTFTGGTGIDTSGSGNAVTFAIDSTVTTLSGSQTLTNKTLTDPVITNITSTGNISLDSAGGNVNFVKSGTQYGVFFSDSSNFNIRSLVSDKDVIFSGSDGGASITALTLDMSEAGAATFNSTVTLGSNNAIQFVDANESVKSDGSKLIITSGGTTFNLPTADGTSGQALVTDGSGTLSFDTVTTTVSDDTRAVVKNNKKVNTSAKTVDYFQDTAFDMAWYFMALNDLTNDHTSGSVFTVCHNNTTAFIGSARGGCSGTGNLLPTTSADIAADQVRVKITGPSADGKVSFYKIPISTANTADATSGNTVTTSNVDVDSASESVDTFAHASFRAAKYTILIDDDAKTETGVTEALVVHDGTNAFVAQFGTVNTGNNNMITLSAAISGSNVVLSAAGLTTNLKLKIHKILLSDSMTAIANSNQKVIGATTVSSTATAFDSFDLDDTTAAVYYVVGKNDTESAYSIQEVYMAGDIGEAGISSGPFVSTKGTTQLEFTGAYIGTADNTVQMTVSATSGASTVVNAYRISCLAEE